MAEQTLWRDEPGLERALREAGRQLAYPPTPPLSASVAARLRVEARRPAGARRPRWPWPAFAPPVSWLAGPPVRRALAAALLALALFGGLLGLSPASRAAVAERLGLKGLTLGHVPAAPSPAAAPEGASLARRLLLGDLTTLDQARRRVPYRVLTPTASGLDTPDEVYVGQPPPGGQVSLVYRAAPDLPAAPHTGVGLLVTQFRGAVEADAGFLGKGLGPGTRLEHVTVNGGRGFWIEGQSHAFFYRDQAGQPQSERVRLAGNVLLWEQEGLTLRLESALPKDEALRIAASVR